MIKEFEMINIVLMTYYVGLVIIFIDISIMTYLKVLKRILWYIKNTIELGLFYGCSNNFDPIGYCDSDWAGNIDNRKCTTSFVFYLGDKTFT